MVTDGKLGVHDACVSRNETLFSQFLIACSISTGKHGACLSVFYQHDKEDSSPFPAKRNSFGGEK